MSKTSFYTIEKLGPKQSLTPEGFLLCEEVPIARTGMMVYGPNEVPVSTGPEGYIKIFREEEDVFRPETIASAQGKPVTDDHPDDDVRPETWKELTHGIALNVRRGEGGMDDLLLADFLITTPEGIEAVQSGKREVSCGYEADYEETAPGVGKQTNIIINHIALVESGRCGPRCAIGDHNPIVKEKSMATKDKKHIRSKILDTLMKAFKAKDAEEIEKLAEEVTDEDFPIAGGGEGEGGETHIHIHAGGGEGSVSNPDDTKTFDDEPTELAAHIEQNAAEHAEMTSRIEALEAKIAALGGGGGTTDEDEEEAAELKEQMADEVPEELQTEAAKAKDSSYLVNAHQDTVGLAEILVPGIRIPTFDRAASPVASFRKICGLRRQALDLAYGQPATRGILDELLGGKKLDTSAMTCDSVRTLFRSAATMAKSANNGQRGNTADFDAGTKPAGVKTLADINRRNAELYGK